MQAKPEADPLEVEQGLASPDLAADATLGILDACAEILTNNLHQATFLQTAANAGKHNGKIFPKSV